MKRMLLALLLAALPGFALADANVQPIVVNGTDANGAYTTCVVGSGAAGTCTLPTDTSVSVTVTSASLSAATTGGCAPYHLAGGTAASTNSTTIKAAAAGTLCSLSAVNTTTTIYYLRLYNSAAAPTCSSATGAVHTYPIPASASGGSLVVDLGAYGEAFSSGIGFCVTGGGADTDNTNAATGVWINASFK